MAAIKIKGTIMADIELKNCPHCDGNVELDTMQGFTPLGGGPIGHQVAISCLECPAQMSFCHDDWDGHVDDLVIQVCEDWNKRKLESDPAEDDALPLVISWVHQLLSDYDVSSETIKGDVELDQSIRDLIKTIRNKH